MFLDALILILQEITEAALLISLLLALGSALQRLQADAAPARMHWVLAALGFGLGGALLYGRLMPVTSSWFDYAGYEVLNALMQFLMIVLLIGCVWLMKPAQATARRGQAMTYGMVALVALGIVREGSEIILYLNGVLAQPGNLTPVTLGALMAAGIGCSAALLLYYFVVALSPRNTLRVTLVLLALFNGNMAAQAMLLLTQADWLPYTPQVWNSSALLPEQGIAGQLLYTLVGYEATPSLLQLGAYVVAAVLIAAAPLFRGTWRGDAGR